MTTITIRKFDHIRDNIGEEFVMCMPCVASHDDSEGDTITTVAQYHVLGRVLDVDWGDLFCINCQVMLTTEDNGKPVIFISDEGAPTEVYCTLRHAILQWDLALDGSVDTYQCEWDSVEDLKPFTTAVTLPEGQELVRTPRCLYEMCGQVVHPSLAHPSSITNKEGRKA